MQHTFNSVALIVYSRSMLPLKKDAEVGRIYINLELLKANSTREGWFNLIPTYDGGTGSLESTGALNIVVKNREESILPMGDYAAFWKLVVEDDLEVVQTLSELISDREELTSCLLNIFEGTGGIPAVISFLNTLVKNDIKKTGPPFVTRKFLALWVAHSSFFFSFSCSFRGFPHPLPVQLVCDQGRRKVSPEMRVRVPLRHPEASDSRDPPGEGVLRD